MRSTAQTRESIVDRAVDRLDPVGGHAVVAPTPAAIATLSNNGWSRSHA